MTTNEHARANVKCALLGGDGRCIAQKVRPIPCSSWCSLSRQQCKVAFRAEPAMSGVSIDPVMHKPGRGAQTGLCVGAFRLGLGAKTCELHSPVLRALDTPDAVERWARGEDMFAGCKEPRE